MSDSKIYVAPDGKVYQRVGIDISELPEFGENEYGDLTYQYSKGQEVHDFTVDENGNLASDYWENMVINEDGTINTDISWELVTDTGVSPAMQKNIDLLRSHNKIIRMKVTLLDTNYMEVDSLTGSITGYPTYDIDCESDIRRTCSLTLCVPAKEQLQLDFEKTWNNRMVELACGIYDTGGNDYVWYNLGRMLMVNGDSRYDATTQEIKLNLVDLMAMMTQERGSQIGETYLFQAGDDPKDLIEALLAENTIFSDTEVCEFDDTIPYDVSSNQGDYAIDVLHLIFDLFPYYEFFYRADGKFIVQQIPTKISDPVDIGANIIDDILISESRQTDFSKIKNTTEIWGRSLSGDYIAVDCQTRGSKYVITIDESFTEMVSGETFTVVPLTTSVSGQTMQVQTLSAYTIYTVDGAGTTYTPLEAGAMKGGVAYVLRYFEEKFILEGELQIRCIVQEITEEPSAAVKEAYKTRHACDNVKWVINPDSPYACTVNSVTGQIQGEVRQVLTDGEYENIYTTQLAYERASYENYLACRLQDEIELEMILVPWMDVNNKIQYHSPVSGDLVTYIIKSISYDLSNWTMNVKASKFYPYYPWD